MWHGVHARPSLDEIKPVGAQSAEKVVLIADPGTGPELDPWVVESGYALNQRHPDGRFQELADFVPVGAIVVGYSSLEADRRKLYELLMSLEAKIYCFDGIPVDVAFLDELAEFVQAKQASGEWIQVIVESSVPTDRESRENLLDLASMMSVSTSEGVVEDGRQISLVMSQYEGAAVDFAVAFSRTKAGDTSESIILSRDVEIKVSEDWLGCFAEAGIIGFTSGEPARVYAAVNLVQGDSPYRQLMATRVLQWFLAEWSDSLRFIPGETVELGLYEVQRVTESLITEYRKSEYISDAAYGISFSAGTGEITCDIVLYPYYGIEGISGVGTARVEKG